MQSTKTITYLIAVSFCFLFVHQVSAQTSPVLAKNIEQVLYADQYLASGAIDIGAAINQAIQNLPNQCGTVEVPSGSYNFTTRILKSRCVVIRGQGTEATHLIYTLSTGTALVIADALDTSQAGHGGIRDLSLETTNGALGGHPISGANGIFMGGDPSGVLVPNSDFAEAQDLTNVRIAGFGTPLTMGSNVFWENFYNLQIIGNSSGITELANASDSGEAINFFGGYISGNGGSAFVNANFENHLFGTAIDFDGSGGAAVTNSNLECFSCHFEISSGSFYSGNHFVAYGGVFLNDAPSGTQPYLFLMNGSAANLRLEGTNLFSNSPVTQLVNWQSDTTYGGELTLNNIIGNGNYAIGNGTYGLAGLLGTTFTVFAGVDINSKFNGESYVLHGASPVFSSGIILTDTSTSQKYKVQITNGQVSLTPQ